MPKSVLGGRYTVLDKIGVGGMASVYRGMDTVLNRSVAIKIMLEQYASDPSFAARFKQEAQAAAALASPYIVGIYDWGKDGDTYYIVMELLRGTDLKTGLKNHGALEPRKVAQIGSQICQALTVAHRHDIIHRDIKPQNIMVQPDGNIKVMDFGIARARNSHLTATNSVLGTAHYVSPEQTQGKELGPTSDIYSLGIVMYEAATGKVPFDGDDAISVALKQVNEEPIPPSELNPNVDANLEAIILKCMAKDPAQRYQTADELRHALLDYLSGRVVTATVKNGDATALVPATSTRRIGQGGATMTQQIHRPQTTNGANSGNGASSGGSIYNKQETPPKRKTGRIVAIVVAIAAVVGLLLWFFFGQSTPTEMVPNYVSLTRAEAEQAITQSDFWTLGTVSSEYSETVERGVVISQDPLSNTPAPKGTAISLVVSRGKEPAEEVSVPDLKKKTPDEAQRELEAVGLEARVGDPVASNDVEKGRIASQEPQAGATAKAGDAVTYHLSSGPESKDVPNVSGYARADAVSALEQAGFSVSEEQVYSNEVDEGYVIDYSPSGTQPVGTTITIQVSLGQNDVRIINTIGMDVDSATSELENLGFSVNYDYRDNRAEPAGQVVGYSPAGSAPVGSTITLVVSNGPGTGGESASGGGTGASGVGGSGGTGGTGANGAQETTQ